MLTRKACSRTDVEVVQVQGELHFGRYDIVYRKTMQLKYFNPGTENPRENGTADRVYRSRNRHEEVGGTSSRLEGDLGNTMRVNSCNHYVLYTILSFVTLIVTCAFHHRRKRWRVDNPIAQVPCVAERCVDNLKRRGRPLLVHQLHDRGRVRLG